MERRGIIMAKVKELDRKVYLGDSVEQTGLAPDEYPIERVVSVRNFHLVTYGCGDSFRKNSFVPIKNRTHTKPAGGLWASPVGCAYGWKEWGEAESFGDFTQKFETMYEGRTLTINSLRDLAGVIWQRDFYGTSYPDYEAMLRLGVDGIYMTEQGESETRHSQPGLYGYDCECVLVMNPECVRAY
jgi:hypothetical protein